MDSFIAEALSQRPKNKNLSGRFRAFSLLRFNIINLPGSGEQLVLAGSTSSGKVKSQQFRTCRHFFYHSGHARDPVEGTLLTSWDNSVTGCFLSHLTLPLKFLLL